jgi:hypothetical protein
MQGRMPWLRLVQVILVGVETGRFVDQWFLGRAFLSLDAAAYSQAFRALGVASKVSMLTTGGFIGAFFVAILLAERDVTSPRGKLTVAGLAVYVALMTFTGLAEFPLTQRIAAMDSGAPGWDQMRAQWPRGHAAQALLGLAIFAMMAEALRRKGRSEG